MKLVITIALAVALLGSLVGCGKKDDPAPQRELAAEQAASAEPADEETKPEPAAPADPTPAAVAPAAPADPAEACRKAVACCNAAATNDDERGKCKQLDSLYGLVGALKPDAQAQVQEQCDGLRAAVARNLSPAPDACK